MASARMAFLALSMVLLSSYAMAVDYHVGDDKGWHPGYDYSQWTKDKVFRVGDNLVFNYDNTKHNVLKLNGTQFHNCSFTADNQVFAAGNDIIPLKAEGQKWYVCGKDDHCIARQMKLTINVVAPSPEPAPSSSAHSLISSLFVPAMLAFAAIFA